jgi:HSP20 family protein
MLSTSFTNDVRQTLDQFRRSVDQMFEGFYGQTQASPPNVAGEPNWTFRPVVESGWTDSFLNLRVILPGVSEKDVQVSVQHNQLVVRGERKAPEGFEKNGFTQLAYGHFYTALTLPTGLDLDRLRCQMRNGVLDIQAPIAETSKPRQIKIDIGEERKAIGA